MSEKNNNKTICISRLGTNTDAVIEKKIVASKNGTTNSSNVNGFPICGKLNNHGIKPSK